MKMRETNKLSIIDASNNDIYMANSFAEINKSKVLAKKKNISNFDEIFLIINVKTKNSPTSYCSPKHKCQNQHVPCLPFISLSLLSFFRVYLQPTSDMNNSRSTYQTVPGSQTKPTLGKPVRNVSFLQSR